jgi:hypothetical protein
LNPLAQAARFVRRLTRLLLRLVVAGHDSFTVTLDLQNGFEVYAYPVADLFLDFRINRTRVLVKYNHFNSGLMQQEGYFVTPDYTGYRSFLDLGITWYLFD